MLLPDPCDHSLLGDDIVDPSHVEETLVWGAVLTLTLVRTDAGGQVSAGALRVPASTLSSMHTGRAGWGGGGGVGAWRSHQAELQDERNQM